MVAPVNALVELRSVVKHFPVSRSLGEIVRGERPAVHALDGVSFDIGAGDAVAIVGESGCGKTTLGRLMLKLTEPTGGTISFDGAALSSLAGEGLKAFRRQAQLVFQNPFDALNPRFTIYRAVAEPLLNAGIDKSEHADRVASAFRRVHLPDLERYLDRYPHHVRQRPRSFAIAGSPLFTRRCSSMPCHCISRKKLSGPRMSR